PPTFVMPAPLPVSTAPADKLLARTAVPEVATKVCIGRGCDRLAWSQDRVWFDASVGSHPDFKPARGAIKDRTVEGQSDREKPVADRHRRIGEWGTNIITVRGRVGKRKLHVVRP